MEMRSYFDPSSSSESEPQQNSDQPVNPASTTDPITSDQEAPAEAQPPLHETRTNSSIALTPSEYEGSLGRSYPPVRLEGQYAETQSSRQAYLRQQRQRLEEEAQRAVYQVHPSETMQQPVATPQPWNPTASYVNHDAEDIELVRQTNSAYEALSNVPEPVSSISASREVSSQGSHQQESLHQAAALTSYEGSYYSRPISNDAIPIRRQRGGNDQSNGPEEQTNTLVRVNSTELLNVSPGIALLLKTGPYQDPVPSRGPVEPLRPPIRREDSVVRPPVPGPDSRRPRTWHGAPSAIQQGAGRSVAEATVHRGNDDPQWAQTKQIAEQLLPDLEHRPMLPSLTPVRVPSQLWPQSPVSAQAETRTVSTTQNQPETPRQVTEEDSNQKGSQAFPLAQEELQILPATRYEPESSSRVTKESSDQREHRALSLAQEEHQIPPATRHQAKISPQVAKWVSDQREMRDSPQHQQEPDPQKRLLKENDGQADSSGKSNSKYSVTTSGPSGTRQSETIKAVSENPEEKPSSMPSKTQSQVTPLSGGGDRAPGDPKIQASNDPQGVPRIVIVGADGESNENEGAIATATPSENANTKPGEEEGADRVTFDISELNHDGESQTRRDNQVQPGKKWKKAPQQFGKLIKLWVWRPLKCVGRCCRIVLYCICNINPNIDPDGQGY